MFLRVSIAVAVLVELYVEYISVCSLCRCLMTSARREVTLEAIHPGTEEEVTAMAGEDYYDPVTREARPLINLSRRWRDYP